MEHGVIFNLQRFSVHDGPGIRTTVFLKGCPLRCLWCHNPESLAFEPELAVAEGRCIGCSECVTGCPRPAGPLGDRVGCEACGRCVAVCPTGARQILGRTWSVEGLMAAVLRDRDFHEMSGGGVTFSGGEPLAQPAFLVAALTACRAEGVHTTLDTSGFAPREALLEAAALADLVLFDLKVLDDAVHREVTGVSNQPILANLRALAAVHPAIWLRVPVIAGINDDPAGIEAIAVLAAGLPAVRRVSLLPYHATGSPKAKRLGRPPAREFATPSHEHMEALARLVTVHGLQTTIGG
ncbi:MAG TPA: glycyl-radical enzyme activating protein [Thermoanaerobaculaceae bacterium]|nr:glycyl-radical enzyme activating protein [Thermoanaerobaculaceae bacterium]HPS77283.1 glycyl-radical enzyme activating protein [Thermoanaerobaculaceae bacterium]